MKRLCVQTVLLLCLCAGAQAASLHSSVRTGIDQFDSEQYDKALQTFLAAQIDNPDNALLKFNIAACHYKLGSYEEAAAGYLDAAMTAQDIMLEEHALYNLGNTMYRQGKLEEAVEYYKKALELDPEDEEAQKNLDFVREEIKRRMNEARDTQKRREQGQKDNQQNRQDQQNQQGQQAQQNQQGQQDQQNQQGQQEGQGSPDDGQAGGMQKPEAQAGQQGESSGQEDMSEIPGMDRPMSAEEAEQWLRGLEENRGKLQEHRQRGQGRSHRPEKDW